MAIPQEYICSITLLPMKDPVIGSDGQTYEREAITQWLQSHNNSPLTRQPMTIESLRTNHSLKSAIERWNKKPKIKTSLVPPQPSAPLTKNSTQMDYYVAMSLYQQDLEAQQQPLLLQPQPLVISQPQPRQQQQKKVQACLVCVCIFVVLIIIFSKIVN
jgi:hypothetical protein